MSNDQTIDSLRRVVEHLTAERDAAMGREANAKIGLAKHWLVVCDQRTKIDALQLSLTAADERNDEVIDLLRRARAVIEGGGWADLERDIAKFFKPAEGGGDEAI